MPKTDTHTAHLSTRCTRLLVGVLILLVSTLLVVLYRLVVGTTTDAETWNTPKSIVVSTTVVNP